MMEALTTKIESLDSRENPNEAVSDSPQIRFFLVGNKEKPGLNRLKQDYIA